MNALEALFDHIAAAQPRSDRPAVTLTYAQSLDGSIATRERRPLALSGPESMAMTHRLRAGHDAILVGIGTVLADDPQLTVRLAEGEDPQPVVLDTRLRFPPTARLLEHPKGVWIAAREKTEPGKREMLERRGAKVLTLPTNLEGGIELPALLAHLLARGVCKLMVEGGAQVITRFLRAGLVDTFVLTVSPHLAGGLPAVGNLNPTGLDDLPRLRNPQWQQMGADLVVWGGAG